MTHCGRRTLIILGGGHTVISQVTVVKKYHVSIYLLVNFTPKIHEKSFYEVVDVKNICHMPLCHPINWRLTNLCFCSEFILDKPQRKKF